MTPAATEHMLVRHIKYLTVQLERENTSPQRKAELEATIKDAKADLEALRIQQVLETA